MTTVDTARAKKPSTFAGCTFDSSNASEASVTGVLMDGLCYDNFVVQQKNINGAPGLAPDKVHVRSEAHLHTRACLVVDYCARTGFYLLQHSGEPEALTHTKLARMEAGSGAEQVYDWMVEARHPCGTTTTVALITRFQHLARMGHMSQWDSMAHSCACGLDLLGVLALLSLADALSEGLSIPLVQGQPGPRDPRTISEDGVPETTILELSFFPDAGKP